MPIGPATIAGGSGAVGACPSSRWRSGAAVVESTRGGREAAGEPSDGPPSGGNVPIPTAAPAGHVALVLPLMFGADRELLRPCNIRSEFQVTTTPDPRRDCPD